MFQKCDKCTYIDFILTNLPNWFQHSNVFETRISDFYLLNVTEFKFGFQKLSPKIVNYSDYKILGMKILGWISLNLILELLVWKVLKMQPSAFLVNMPLLKENISVQMNLHLWVNNSKKPFSYGKAYTPRRNFSLKKLLRKTKRTYLNNLDVKKIAETEHIGKLLFGCFKINFGKWENKSDWWKWNDLSR